MAYAHFAPHPALLEFIDSVFVLDIDFRARPGLSAIYPFVPTHNRFLCFYLHDQLRVRKQVGDFLPRSRAIIIGPQLNPPRRPLRRRVVVHRTHRPGGRGC